MAKFNVMVELDWMDDAGSMDDEIKQSVISSVAEAMKAKMLQQIDSECTKACEAAMKSMNEQIDKRINTMMDEFFDTPHDITDSWGDVVKRGVSVKDIMKKKCDNFMNARVDDRGVETDSFYGRTYNTRTEYMMHQILDSGMKKEIENTIKSVAEDAKKKIREQVAARLGDEVGKLINIESILK